MGLTQKDLAGGNVRKYSVEKRVFTKVNRHMVANRDSAQPTLHSCAEILRIRELKKRCKQQYIKEMKHLHALEKTWKKFHVDEQKHIKDMSKVKVRVNRAQNPPKPRK
jgi:hypothetical protein